MGNIRKIVEKSNFLSRLLKKKIPKEVEKDCELLVQQLVEWEPRIESIWLFGSYAWGCWKEASDIDIGVFVSAPEYYYIRRDTLMIYGLINGSEAVDRLRDSVKGKTLFDMKYEIHIFCGIMKDTHIAREARRGKALFKREGPLYNA